MKKDTRICSICWNNSGCDEGLSPQLVSRHGSTQEIGKNDTQFSQSACRHFTCTYSGVYAAEDALFMGKFETIKTTDGPVKATTFESEDKRTKGLRWIAESGDIYSCENKGGVFRKTGQRLDKEGRLHY